MPSLCQVGNHRGQRRRPVGQRGAADVTLSQFALKAACDAVQKGAGPIFCRQAFIDAAHPGKRSWPAEPSRHRPPGRFAPAKTRRPGARSVVLIRLAICHQHHSGARLRRRGALGQGARQRLLHPADLTGMPSIGKKRAQCEHSKPHDQASQSRSRY